MATRLDSYAAAMSATDGAVRANDVTVRYGEHLALCDASFSLPSGAITAVIGPNGSGKTTLLRTISGLESVDAGSLEVLGGPAGARRRDVAHVMQNTKVNDSVPLTVREVVGMGRYATLGAFRPFRQRDHQAVDEALARMDVADLADRHLRDLSGGQRQRVYVAQGLAQDADLLLLDEPVTGLDVVSQERISQVMREETAAGRTVVFTTHDVQAAAASDHVLLLATHVITSAPPTEALTTECLAEAYGGHVFRTPEGAVVLGDPHQHAPLGASHPHQEHDHTDQSPAT